MIETVKTLMNNENLVASNWELGFLESIHQQLVGGKNLSPRQVQILDRIEKKNSEEAILELKEWYSNWQRDCESTAIIIANYYKATGTYFSASIKKVLQGEPLTREAYERMCENEYAEKVLREHHKEPNFETGSLVQVRSNTTINNHYLSENDNCYAKINNMHAIVLEVNALPVKRAAKGAKVYKILPIGSPKAYYVSESDLKKPKKVK